MPFLERHQKTVLNFGSIRNSRAHIAVIQSILIGNILVSSAVANRIFVQDANERVRVACIGDSITFGATIDDPNDSYPSQLGRKLGSRYDVKNFGVNGCTMLKNGDYPYWKQEALSNVVAFSPHIVIIVLGTNDCKTRNWTYKQQYTTDCASMIEMFKANTKVFVCLPPPVYAEVAGITETIICDELMPVIKKTAQLKSVAVIDLHTALNNKEVLFPDKVHPNLQGAEIIAQQVCAAVQSVLIEINQCPGTKSDWFGYSKYDFIVQDVNYCVVLPKRRALGSPWIWRAEFFGYEPQVELELLKNGWCVVYNNSAAGRYGSPKAVAIWNKSYEYLNKQHHFSSKVVLEGVSRGGLLVYSWAAKNPEKVACIYGYVPVCDIKSWPGAKGSGDGSSDDWRMLLNEYNFTETQAMEYKSNPIDYLIPLAKANIPLLHVCGDADNAVPMEENTTILASRYKELGGRIEVIIKEGRGHGLNLNDSNESLPIVKFILKSFEERK